MDQVARILLVYFKCDGNFVGSAALKAEINAVKTKSEFLNHEIEGLRSMAFGGVSRIESFTGSISSFRRALKRTTIELPKGQAAHVLRHTFASHFMMKGGNILALQKILGHSDIKMTMRYAHLAPNYFLDAIKLNPLATK